MKDHHAAEDHVARDLRALRLAAGRDLPAMEETMRAAQARVDHITQEGAMTRTIRLMRGRPWLATAAGVAAAAVVLLLVPVSYDRTIGHEVTVEVSGPELSRGDIEGMVADLESSLGAEGVRVATDGSIVVLEALSPSRSRAAVEEVMLNFANSLAARGLHASSRIGERVETVNGSVYAMAGNMITELRILGGSRSAEEIEQDLRSQLEEAGIVGADIDVRVEGEQTTIEVGWSEERGEGTREERIKIMRQGTAETECVVPMQQLDIERQPGMTDEEFRNYVIQELEAAGIHGAEVTVLDNGQVMIKVEQEGGCD